MKTLSQLFAQIKNKHDSDDQTNIKNQKTIKVVSMKGTYYPENGTLTQNQLEKLANLKKDGRRQCFTCRLGCSHCCKWIYLTK